MKIFNDAHIKLTTYYLAIIMAISLFFSLIIYQGATAELDRIQKVQRGRIPFTVEFLIDPDIISDTKRRIAFSLFKLNMIILIVSGVAGYFLAKKTLQPISEMVEEQKDFIANASHELRTPLASMKSEIEVGLRNKTMKLSEAKGLLQSNLDDVNKMTELSNYLLRLNKMQNQQSKTYSQVVDLDDVVKSVVGKKKIKLQLENVKVKGDKNSLSELVSILLDNAIKYSPGEDSVTIATKTPKTLVVEDKGEGMGKEDLPHIFDRFYRADKSRTKQGYGLGLTIAKQIADAHDARIKVESKLGVGSTFKVIFS